MEWNDRRDGGGLKLFQPTPYFPQRGRDKGPSVGVQGKLFREPKPVDSARYPRGYTPDRMRELSEARVDIQPGEKGAFAGPAGAHQIKQVIARSTTPAHELIQPYYSHEEPDDMWPLRIHSGSTGLGAAGIYEAGDHRSRGTIRLAPQSTYVHPGQKHAAAQQEERVGQTLMHELGHYRSAIVSKNPSRHYSTPTERGKEEAFADDNEVERWRPDPRDVRRGISKPVQPTYEIEQAHQGIGGKKSFGPYLRARKTPLQRVTRKGEYKPQQRNGVQLAIPPAELSRGQFGHEEARYFWNTTKKVKD